MGIDIDGGMIVGEEVNKINIPEKYEDIYEWFEDTGMSKFSPWFDAEIESCVVGFMIHDISVDDINDSWIESIREKAARFKEITGIPAKLIGMQDVW